MSRVSMSLPLPGVGANIASSSSTRCAQHAEAATEVNLGHEHRQRYGSTIIGSNSATSQHRCTGELSIRIGNHSVSIGSRSRDQSQTTNR
jgi:hypothetical protein